jgi:hypothetical protein
LINWIKITDIAIENDHLYWIYPLKMVDLSIVTLVYPRVNQIPRILWLKPGQGYSTAEPGYA